MPTTEEQNLLDRTTENHPNQQAKNRPPEHPHHIATGKIILVSLLLAAVVAAVAEVAAGDPVVVGTVGAGDLWKTVTEPLVARLG